MKRLPCIVAAMIGLTACGPKDEPLNVTSKFDPVEAAYINQAGTATVSGQAFLRTMVGEVRYAAGSRVDLVPATAYARERISKIYGQGKCSTRQVNFAEADQRYVEMTRKAKANGEGRFRFANIAPGDYFVVTYVVWKVPTGQYGASTEGCGMYEPVTAIAGRDTEIIMSGE